MISGPTRGRIDRVDRIDRRWLLVLAAVFVLALVPRTVVAVQFDQPPRLTNDAGWYDVFGKQIAQGKGYSVPFVQTPTAVWPPGYPFYLGGLYKLTDESRLAARLSQAVLGALTAVLAAELGRRLFSRNAGAAAGVVMAFVPGHIFFTPLLMSEVLFTLLVTAALVAGVRAHSYRDAALTGILLGAATLVRPQGLLMVLAIAAGWAGFGYFRRAERTHSLAMLALTLVAAAAVVTPWSVRNVIRLDAFVPVSTNLGINLWIGNNPQADGGFRPGNTKPFEDAVANLPRPELEVTYDRLAREAALRYIREHPRDAISNWPNKIYLLYEDDVTATNWYQPLGADYLSPHTEDRIDLMSNVYYYAMLITAAAGVALLAFERSRGLVLPLAVLAVWTMVSLVFFAEPRFHIPVYPAFALLAGAAIARVFELATQRLSRVQPHATADESAPQPSA